MIFPIDVDVPAMVEKWSETPGPKGNGRAFPSVAFWESDFKRMFYALLKSTDLAPNDNIAVDAMKSAFKEVFPTWEIEIKERY